MKNCAQCGSWDAGSLEKCRHCGAQLPAHPTAPPISALRALLGVPKPSRRASSTPAAPTSEVHDALAPYRRAEAVLTHLNHPAEAITYKGVLRDTSGRLLRERTHFECPKCGRLADAAAALAEYEESLKLVPHPGLKKIQSTSPGRPAALQRKFGLSYEEAVAAIDLPIRLGLLERINPNVLLAAASPCDSCLQEMREKVITPSAPAPASARSPIPARIRFLVLQRDGFKCIYCGRGREHNVALQVDHVIPVSAGGATDLDNLATACTDCNLGKSAIPVIPD